MLDCAGRPLCRDRNISISRRRRAAKMHYRAARRRRVIWMNVAQMKAAAAGDT